MLAGILSQLLELPDVAPGTECSGVAAVKYQTADLRPLRDLPENTVEVAKHLLVDKVERAAVEADLGDRTDEVRRNERRARRRASTTGGCRHDSVSVPVALWMPSPVRVSIP